MLPPCPLHLPPHAWRACHTWQVCFHAKLNTNCRCAVGIECVAKRVEISTNVLQGLYGELDRARLADDLLKGVSFEAADATQYASLDYSHIYMFDRVFSEITLIGMAKVREASITLPPLPLTATCSGCPTWQVLQRSDFYVLISSRKPQVWWRVGLNKIQPVAKLRFKTTGREGCTAFVYINSHYIPGL